MLPKNRRSLHRYSMRALLISLLGQLSDLCRTPDTFTSPGQVSGGCAFLPGFHHADTALLPHAREHFWVRRSNHAVVGQVSVSNYADLYISVLFAVMDILPWLQAPCKSRHSSWCRPSIPCAECMFAPSQCCWY